MAGFEQLESAINLSEALAPITAEEVAFEDESLDDATALGIVVNDADIAERFLQSKNLIFQLDAADDLYRAYVKPRTWPGTDKPRANLGMPVVLEAIEKLLPALHLALFGNRKTPFVLEPTGRTSPKAARAKEKLLAWAVKQSGFREEIRRSLKTCLQYGFVVGQWGWEDCEKKRKIFKVQADGTVKREVEDYSISQPSFVCLDLRKVLVDPNCDTQDVRKSAKYVIKQLFTDGYGLDDLRDDDGYKNIPDRTEIAQILAQKNEPATDTLVASKTNTYRDLQAESATVPQSTDPLMQPLEILEYWTADRVITVLQRKIVIRNEPNEFAKLPFVSCAFIDVLNSAWGFGVAKLLSGEQRFQQGVVNSWIDGLALILNPVFQLLKGLGPGTQNITVAPGKVITETGELKPLIVPSATQDAMAAIETSKERAGQIVGANGGSDMPTQAMRTAAGVQGFQGDVSQRLEYFLSIFSDMIFIPTLEAFIDQMEDKLTPKQINEILTETDKKSYEGDVQEVYEASCEVDVLAGARLSVRASAAQLVPMLIQLIQQQPVQDALVVQNKKFDFEELLEETLDLSGWDIDSLIIPMTPEDTQRAQQQNPQFVRGQQDQQLEAQKHQNDLDNIEQKGVAQAGVAIVRQAAKEHLDQAASAFEAEQNAGVPNAEQQQQ